MIICFIIFSPFQTSCTGGGESSAGRFFSAIHGKKGLNVDNDGNFIILIYKE
jgi:hypothetical protein